VKPLAQSITLLRDQSFSELKTTHDYYEDPKVVWRILRLDVAAGRQFSNLNRVTGTETDQFNLAQKARGYVAEQLAEATFQQFLSVFENFLFELLSLWLKAYPRSLGKKMVDYNTILELPDKDAITDLVVRRELNDVLYDRPANWFAYLEDKVKLGCPTAQEIARIAEAKAGRDVLVHNRGLVNKTYLDKSGSLARFKVGKRLRIPERYHRETWVLVRKVVADVANAAIAKASKEAGTA